MALHSILPASLAAVVTPGRRDFLVTVIALSLLSLPVFTSLGFIGTTDNQYERTEVVTVDGELRYADPGSVPDGVPISEDIACAGTQVERACAVESLVGNQTVSLGVQSDAESLEDDQRIAPKPYRFVQLDDGMYRALYTKNETNTVHASLQSTSAETARRAVSVPVDPPETSPNPEKVIIPDTVATAAREGQASSRTAVDVPKHPIRVDGRYYRVYRVSEASEGTTTPFSLLTIFAAGLGGIMLLSIFRNVRISYHPN
jgi:hypothetical protein